MQQSLRNECFCIAQKAMCHSSSNLKVASIEKFGYYQAAVCL